MHGKRRLLAASMLATLLSATSGLQAQETVRELRDPEAMARVAPMRAIGIRLSPPAPTQAPPALSIPALPIPVSLPIPAPLPASASQSLAIPRLPEPVPPASTKTKVSLSEADERPKMPEPMPTSVSRKPERFRPKPMMVEAAPALSNPALVTANATDHGTSGPPIRIVPQAPIRLSFSNEAIISEGSSTSDNTASNSIHVSSTESRPSTTHLSGDVPGASRSELSVAAAPPAIQKSLSSLKATESASPIVAPALAMEVGVAAAPIPQVDPKGTLPDSDSKSNAFDRSLPPPDLLVQAPMQTATPEMILPSSNHSLLTPPVGTGAMPQAPKVPASLAIATGPSTFIAPDMSLPELEAPKSVRDPAPTLDSNVVNDVSAGSSLHLASATRPVIKTYSEAELATATCVELESQAAREIVVDGSIETLTVNQDQVCRALAADGRVYLVGGSLGEAVVEVRIIGNDQPKLLRVKVVAPWSRANHGVADLEQLHQALQPLCPNTKLTVRPQSDGSVTIQGKVDSEATAKRILELTRKLILVPVNDKLEVR